MCTSDSIHWLLIIKDFLQFAFILYDKYPNQRVTAAELERLHTPVISVNVLRIQRIRLTLWSLLVVRLFIAPCLGPSIRSCRSAHARRTNFPIRYYAFFLTKSLAFHCEGDAWCELWRRKKSVKVTSSILTLCKPATPVVALSQMLAHCDVLSSVDASIIQQACSRSFLFLADRRFFALLLYRSRPKRWR